MRAPASRPRSASRTTVEQRRARPRPATNGQPAASAAWPSRSSSPMNGVRVRSRSMLALGLEQHARARLAAVAALVPVVGAVVDRVDPAARPLRLGAHPRVDGRRGRPRSSRRGRSRPGSRRRARGSRLARAGAAPRARPAATRTRPGRVTYSARGGRRLSDAVAVEDHRRPAGEERSVAGRRSSEPTL